jgi:hypothetical protein
LESIMLTATSRATAAVSPDAKDSGNDTTDDLLSNVALGSGGEDVTLRSGRRYELRAGETVDTLTVRSASGTVLLRVAVGDDGPLLSFESAQITLSARNHLALAAPAVSVTTGDLRVLAGSSEERIEGHRHAHVGGEDRLEAGAVAIQANEGGVAVKAMHRIALDGEHIGLNDDPAPLPFAWSAIADDQGTEP